jgi:hypothetical protein
LATFIYDKGIICGYSYSAIQQKVFQALAIISRLHCVLNR